MGAAASIAVEKIADTIIEEQQNDSIGEFIDELRFGLSTKDEKTINRIFAKIISMPKYSADKLSVNDFDLINQIYFLEHLFEKLEYRSKNLDW